MTGYKVAVAMCLLLAVVAALPSSSLGSSGDVADIMQECKNYIFKNKSELSLLHRTDSCCLKVQTVNVETICTDFTQVELAQIDLWKWVQVCIGCDRPLRAGYNCHGYTVP
ncbi:hypothetical protein ACP4OV_006888 [Aristida adscensionis]